MQLTEEQKLKLQDIPDTRVITEILDGYIDELKDDAISEKIPVEVAKNCILKLTDLKGKFITRRSQKKQPQFV